MGRFLLNILLIFGIVFLRFRPLPRLWNVWLVAVNLGCLLFITRIEAQVVLGVTLVAVASQAVVYGRQGFTRVLGIAHLLWLPMFAWLASRHAAIAADPALAQWVMLLAATNAVSLVIDTTDVLRFARGERAPHYVWQRSTAIPAA